VIHALRKHTEARTAWAGALGGALRAKAKPGLGLDLLLGLSPVETAAGWEELLEEAGPRGNRALGLAASQGHVSAVRLLLSHGADRTATNKDGHNALGVASGRGHADVVVLLLEERVYL